VHGSPLTITSGTQQRRAIPAVVPHAILSYCVALPVQLIWGESSDFKFALESQHNDWIRMRVARLLIKDV
jgi:hypothetical protein